MSDFENFPMLKNQLWKRPPNYAGPDYVGEVGLYGRSRDSSILEESNFASMLKALKGEDDHVYVIRDRHWAVGWIETMFMKPTAPEGLKQKAEDILTRLLDYPVIDEEDFSRREFDHVAECWSQFADEYIRDFNEKRKNWKGFVPVPEEAAQLSLHEISEQYPSLEDYVHDTAISN